MQYTDKFQQGCSVYLTHGAGPFPILKKELHKGMYENLQQVAKQHPNPKALIVFSAHWEQSEWTIIDQDSPGLLYDYYGFPNDAYKLKYPATSTKELREYVKQSLFKNGYRLKSEAKRGYDHGVFIPLLIMYPQANIPVIQISILDSLDPEQHYKMGVALRELKNQGFLIIGSGASVHGGFQHQQSVQLSKEFNEDLSKVCLAEYNSHHILKGINNWKKWRHSKIMHPREQHLVPAFINLGVYQGKQVVQQKYIQEFLGLYIRNFVFI